jgi:hypothetical protein
VDGSCAHGRAGKATDLGEAAPEQIDSADWDRAFEDALFLDVIAEYTAGPSRPHTAPVRRRRHGRRATRGCRRY